MKRIKEIMAVDFRMITKKDWDNVIIIDGDEGISKSTLAKHIFEDWYIKLYGKCDPIHINKIVLDMKQFVTGLREVKRFECIVYDEAGDLSNLRVINKFNYQITKAYQVIRGLNIFTILVLPSIFDLNPFFTKRRARGLFHVYKRGKVAWWGKKKLRQIVSLNQYSKLKSVWKVKYNWVDSFPKYKGVLKNVYDKKKTDKISSTTRELYAELYPDEYEKEQSKDDVFIFPQSNNNNIDNGEFRDFNRPFRLHGGLNPIRDNNNHVD